MTVAEAMPRSSTAVRSLAFRQARTRVGVSIRLCNNQRSRRNQGRILSRFSKHSSPGHVHRVVLRCVFTIHITPFAPKELIRIQFSQTK